MKVGKYTFSGVSIVLLVIQLALVSAITTKYLYQRWRCPRVWTRASAIDPEMPMRGRYLSLQLAVDGCESTLPSAKNATFPRDVSGAIKPGPYVLRQQPVRFRATLKVENNRLVAVRVEGQEDRTKGERISATPGAPCGQMRLETPVDFYIAAAAHSPLPVEPSQELWIEVTVPPKGSPRPLALAVKQGTSWKPLVF